MSAGAERRTLVGVAPGRELDARRRLLDALEAALPVRFVARLDGVDAVVAFAGHGAGGAPVGARRLLAQGEERTAAGPARSVTLTDDPRLDRRLRGARLTERWAAAPIAVPEHGHVLALGPDGARWALAGRDVLAPAPAELAPDEALRDRLVPGRSLALLALVHFLREVAAGCAYAPPPLQAALIVDDPNLHWPRYGHLDYRALVAHAAEHRYHLSVAMVPLDGWLVHGGTARLFRQHPEALSIAVHGNDHLGHELARPASAGEGRALGLAALHRIEAFERRAAVPVGRVMVPPHERLGEPAACGLLQAGFEAICMSRPYPWLATPERSFLVRPPHAGPLVGWRPADTVAGGLPVLLRNAFSHPREDLVLRAFLDQPLLIYGHHGDLAGLDALAEVAAQVNRLGAVAWRSLTAIARAAADTRREGATLHVRPWTRRVEVRPPPGVRRLVVEPPPGLRARGAPATFEVAVDEREPGPLLVTLPAPALPAPGPAPRRAWPVARRLAGEGRDRLAPVLSALSRR